MTTDDVIERLSIAEPVELLAHLQRANMALRENAETEIELSRNIRDAAVTAQLQDEATITGLLMLAQLPVFDDEGAFATVLQQTLCTALGLRAALLLTAEPDGTLRLVIPDDESAELEGFAEQSSPAVRSLWASGGAAPVVEHVNDNLVIAVPLLRRSARQGILALIAPPGVIDTAANWALLTLIGGIVAAVCERRARIARLRSELRLIEALIVQRTLQIRHSRDVLRAAFDQLDAGILLIDMEGRVAAANQTFCRQILGRHPREVVGTAYARLRDPQARSGARTVNDPRLLPTPGAPQLSRVQYPDASGALQWYTIERTAVAGEDSAVAYVLEIWRHE